MTYGYNLGMVFSTLKSAEFIKEVIYPFGKLLAVLVEASQ